MLYARAYLQGRYVKIRTMETTVREASQVAEEWYLDLRERIRRGVQLHEPLFADVVRDFLTDPTVKATRGGPRNLDSLLRWDPDQGEGVWNATEETELSC